MNFTGVAFQSEALGRSLNAQREYTPRARGKTPREIGFELVMLELKMNFGFYIDLRDPARS